jgi:hypothetical protein
MAKQIKKYSKIALVLGLSIALIATYLTIPLAKAGTLSSREVRLTDSRLSQTAVDYDFLATQSGATSIACIEVQFCTTASGGCTAPSNMDATSADTGDTGDWATLTYANWIIASSSEAFVRASTTDGNAEQLSTGSWVMGNITNSNATNTYFARITTYEDDACSTSFDTGVVAYAILGGVTVSVTVAESLSVAVNASTCDSFITTGTDQASATSSIGFGTLANLDTFYNSCQRIDVGTNASNGYIARIHKTQPLTSGSDTITDGDCDGSCSTTTEATWSNADNNGFGYCMKDRDLAAAQVADSGWATLYCGSGSQSFKVIGNNSGDAQAFMQSGSATSTNRAWVGYRLTVDSVQVPGTYSTVIVYTITPQY